jgi:chemotaxis family two-component system response regulator Rcp1
MEILLVEDSPGDVRLTQEAFREANGTVRLHVAGDGVEAMAFLKKTDTHGGEPRPDLILLDLNLPRMDGREVLGLIKEDEGLRTIPIIILTTSEAEIDIVKSYQLKANCFSATSAPPGTPVPSSTTANSSPPMRAYQSVSRGRDRLRRRTNSCRTASPELCP